MTLDVFIMFIITLLLLRDGNWWKKHALQWLWANWKKKEKDKEEEHAFLPVAPALPGSTGLEGWAEGKISVPPTPERGYRALSELAVSWFPTNWLTSNWKSKV